MITIKIDGIEYNPEMETAAKVDHIEMCRHRREWVIYPVDAEGNQIEGARYGFNKAEAKQIKAEFEAELI